MPRREARRLEAARARSRDLGEPRERRARALLEVAEIQWHLGNHRDAADAAIVALHHLDGSSAESAALEAQACDRVARFEALPFTSADNYATQALLPDTLASRCERARAPVERSGRPTPPVDTQCIEVAECERDGLAEPECTERALAASCGQSPAADTCGCYDLARLFGDRPPIHAEQLAHLGQFAMPNHCPNWAENRTYLRSLEGTTLGATSAYAQARLEAELCGSDAQRWVHHFVLAYLDPQSPDVDRWLDQPTEAVLSEWQRECVATDR